MAICVQKVRFLRSGVNAGLLVGVEARDMLEHGSGWHAWRGCWTLVVCGYASGGAGTTHSLTAIDEA
jgi:hypothetical protein